jgi:tetratricopeptide (TPR) repeat protein
MIRLVIAIATIATLISCAGKKEPAATGPAPVVRDTIHSIRTDTLKITDSVVVKETETFKSLQKSIDSLVAKGEEEKAIVLLKTLVLQYNPVYMGPRTVQLANLLHKTGRSAEALAILESFAVYKPSINSWIDSANALYEKILAENKYVSEGKIDSAKLEIINSLTSQIRNLKNIKASPALIIELADSLRAIAPGDSVLAWLDKQVPAQIENSDPFCEEQIKIATDKFSSSRRNKPKEKALLTESIAALDRCLAKTPSENMKKMIIKRREILNKALKDS